MRINNFVVISHNDLIRYGITSILESASKSDITITTVALHDYLNKISDVQGVVFLDDDIPRHQNIIEVIGLIQSKAPSIRLLIVGNFLSVSYIQQIIDAGADGYIYKLDPLGDILWLAVNTILSGQIFLSPRASALPYERKHHEILNEKDLEVLALLAEGLSAQDIARRIGFVDRSIYRIRARIKNYLGVTNNEQIIDAAHRRQLLD